MPQNVTTQSQTDTDDELELSFSGMAFCGALTTVDNRWIIDSGASDHMIASLSKLNNVRIAPANCVINLPNGECAQISHIGSLSLKNDLILQNVLFVPTFKHNLLSIHRLSKDNNCHVKFTPNSCEILANDTNALLAEGFIDKGLYYLYDDLKVPHASVHTQGAEGSSSAASVQAFSCSQFQLWHNR